MAKNVFRGGQYIIHPGVKPQSSTTSSPPPADWKEGTTISTNERDNLINDYFNGRKKRYFAISKTELEDLVDLSATQCVMIRVENIKFPEKFKMYWLPYRLKDITVDDDYYFIIENEFLYGKNPDDVPNGITYADGTDIYSATIGQKGVDEYYVLINNMGILDDGGGSGEPPGVGTKVPEDI